MSEDKKNVPKIRFPGFTDAWVERKLGELIELRNGYAFQSRYFLDKPSGYVVTTPGNVKIGGGFNENGGQYYDPAGEFPEKYIFNHGDIFVTMTDLTPSAQTLGNPAIVPKNGVKYLHNQRLGKLTKFEGNIDFLFSLLCTNHFHKAIVTTASGTTVRHSSPDKILGYITNVPQLLEQQKIGEFFCNLDNLITLHQRKLNNVQNLKAGLLQKMFPKDGEDFPEVRFPGFTDAWQERRFGELAEFSKGSGYTKNDLIKSGSPILLYGRLYTKYETIINDVDTFAAMKEKSVISEGNEVVVPASGETAEGISRASVIGKSGLILGGDLNIIKPNQKIDPTFLALTISNGTQQKEISKRAKGKSVVHLHNSDLKQANLVYPKLEEQKRIGELFIEIDNLITLHQRKLKHLQEQKKSLLQQMFV